MLLLKTSNLILSAMLTVALLTCAASAQDGKTIFGDTKKETFKAMGLIVKSIGVRKKGKCLYCHIKEGANRNSRLIHNGSSSRA